MRLHEKMAHFVSKNKAAQMHQVSRLALLCLLSFGMLHGINMNVYLGIMYSSVTLMDIEPPKYQNRSLLGNIFHIST